MPWVYPLISICHFNFCFNSSVLFLLCLFWFELSLAQTNTLGVSHWQPLLTLGPNCWAKTLDCTLQYSCCGIFVRQNIPIRLSNVWFLEASPRKQLPFCDCSSVSLWFWLPDQSSRAPDPRSSQFTTALHCWASQASNERKLYVCVYVCVRVCMYLYPVYVLYKEIYCCIIVC